MVHSEVLKNAFFACFRFLIFHPFFQGGSTDPICPYVRTPMAVEGRRGSVYWAWECGATGSVIIIWSRDTRRAATGVHGRRRLISLSSRRRRRRSQSTGRRNLLADAVRTEINRIGCFEVDAPRDPRATAARCGRGGREPERAFKDVARRRQRNAFIAAWPRSEIMVRCLVHQQQVSLNRLTVILAFTVHSFYTSTLVQLYSFLASYRSWARIPLFATAIRDYESGLNREETRRPTGRRSVASRHS